jgi:hypothetical protein
VIFGITGTDIFQPDGVAAAINGAIGSDLKIFTVDIIDWG